MAGSGLTSVGSRRTLGGGVVERRLTAAQRAAATTTPLSPTLKLRKRLPTILPRRQSRTTTEEPVEMADLVEATAERDFQNGQCRKPQQFLGRLQSRFDQHVAKSLSATFPDQMRGAVLAHFQFGGDVLEPDVMCLLGFDVPPDQRAATGHQIFRGGFCLPSRRLESFFRMRPGMQPGTQLPQMFEDKLGFRLVHGGQRMGLGIPRRFFPARERFPMRGTKLRSRTSRAGEDDPLQFKLVINRNDPLHETGMADVVAALRKSMQIGAEPQNLEGRAMSLAAAGFDATTNGMRVLKSGMGQRGGQRSGEIVDGHLKLMDLFERLNGSLGDIEVGHGQKKDRRNSGKSQFSGGKRGASLSRTDYGRGMSFYVLKRNVPIEESYDVVVAGGGPAGAAAAVCAARSGAKTLLIEATGCLGGMGTSGLVTAFDPMANGVEAMVGGFMREVVEELYERKFLGSKVTPEQWRKHFLAWIPFNVEGYKLILDEKMTAAGVEVRFFTRVIDAEADASDKRVKGIVIHNIEGYSFIAAKAFIDCTGDAVLADLCGADCWEAGRDTPRIMPATLPSLFAGIDWERVRRYWKEEGHEQGNGVIRKGIADGMFVQPDPFLVGMSQIGPTVGYLNGGHLFNLNALRCSELSRNVMLGRRIAQDYLAFYRKYIPGYEKMEHVTTASLIGVRESRRIKGEYVLNIDDYMARREFPDQIGIFNKFVDIHPYDTSEEEYQRFMKEKDQQLRMNVGESFGIPYGILVPKGWQNLWVAGRCASSDVRVHGSIRVQPACAMMGQAAGTAAAQSIRLKQSACELDTAELVTTLRKDNALLPQKEISSEMTRGSAT